GRKLGAADNRTHPTSRIRNTDRQVRLDSAVSRDISSLPRLKTPHLSHWDSKRSLLAMRKIDLTNFQVATSETARQINRRITLNLIRTHQPISRADLARYSGLQRTTASDM